MSKARIQIPQKSGRVEVAHGEAVGESASDPLAEHRGTGPTKTKAAPVACWRRRWQERPVGIAQTLMTSSFRTARCEPAHRVVWQGCLLRETLYADMTVRGLTLHYERESRNPTSS